MSILATLLLLHLPTHAKKSGRSPSATTAPHSHQKKGRKFGAKNKRRVVIIPVVKESLAKKAAHTMDLLKKSVMQTKNSAISSTNRLRRELKGYFSSDFEVLLLKLTRPADTRPAEADLDRFLNTVEDFARDLDTTNPTNPYRVTLHKLWNKAAESNGYTVLKTLYLLHMLLRYTQPEDGMIFKKILFKMMRETCTRSGSKYWDSNTIRHVGAETRHLGDFIARYTNYLLKRGRTFTASFEEMKLIAVGMRPEDITAQLLKAIKILDAALLCRTSADEECEVTVCCLELLARDIRELFLLFHTKLRFVVKEDATGDLFQDWNESEVRAILQHFKAFYNDRFDDIQAFLVDVAEVLGMYKITIPTVLNTPVIFDEPIAGRSGGSSGTKTDSNSGRKSLGPGSSGSNAHNSLDFDGDKSCSSFDLESLTGGRGSAAADGGPVYSDLGALSDAAGQRVGGGMGPAVADVYVEGASAADDESWDLPFFTASSISPTRSRPAKLTSTATAANRKVDKEGAVRAGGGSGGAGAEDPDKEA